MRRMLLRVLLMFDAVLLLLLGGVFMFMPGRMLVLFGFQNIPSGFAYVVGIFGAVYATMGIGYLLVAQNPLRNVAWVQVGILRGTAESLFSLFSMAQGLVTFRQAGFSLVVPGLLAVGYALLYPRPKPPAPEVIDK
jgi:hypothetical protein